MLCRTWNSVRLEIQPNRDIEMLKFSRNEIHLINAMDADYFDKLSRTVPGKVRDAGPSLDSEQMWFNQVPTAPIASYKLEWFRSRNFRRAVSAAINRADSVQSGIRRTCYSRARTRVSGESVLV